MEPITVIHGQRYSSLDARNEIETVFQTVIPPSVPPRNNRQNLNYIDEIQIPIKTKKSINFVVPFLILFCIFSSLCFFGLLGYIGKTSFDIYTWTIEDTDEQPEFWKSLDDNTLCFTLAGTDARHYGCAKYLLHDISDEKNYTCCIRDSSQYTNLYQLINQEENRLASSVNNDKCTHSNAVTEVTKNMLKWTPAKNCEINNRTDTDYSTDTITVYSTNTYTIYLTITLKFEKTYKNLPHQEIRIRILRRPFRLPSNNVQEEILVQKKIKIRKEFQNFENIFLQGSFKLNKGDNLSVEILNHRYVHKYNDNLCSIDIIKVL